MSALSAWEISSTSWIFWNCLPSCSLFLWEHDGNKKQTLFFAYSFLTNEFLQQAQRMNTTYIPSLVKERTQFFKLWQQLIQKKSNLFTKSLAVNIVLAVIVTHYQQKAFFRFNQPVQ
jgi:hypothetical protein